MTDTEARNLVSDLSDDALSRLIREAQQEQARRQVRTLPQRACALHG